MKKKLHQVKCALTDVTNLHCTTEKQSFKNKLMDLGRKGQDYHDLEAFFDDMEEANLVLSGRLTAVEKEVSVLSTDTSVTVDAKNMSFCFTTKSGGEFTLLLFVNPVIPCFHIKYHLLRFAQ